MVVTTVLFLKSSAEMNTNIAAMVMDAVTMVAQMKRQTLFPRNMYLGKYLFMKDTKIECYLSFVARQALTSFINLNRNRERAYTAPDPESSKMNSFCEETLGLIYPKKAVSNPLIGCQN